MSTKISTGLRNHCLAIGSFKSAMEAGNGGRIDFYGDDGTVPATADAAVSGTLLLRVTTGGIATGSAGSTVLMQATAVDGVISKAASSLSGLGLANGTLKYYRHVATGDDGTLSTTQCRVQGLCALAGGEANLDSLAIVSGQNYPLDALAFALPTL